MITTATMERVLYHHLRNMRTYFCLEVQMPMPTARSKRERVDLLTYDRDKRLWKCYELKLTKSDFFSKNTHSFHGHYNYFVVPDYLYPEIKESIPDGIGCYTVSSGNSAKCVKKAKAKELSFTHEQMKNALLTALNRECNDYYFEKL